VTALYDNEHDRSFMHLFDDEAPPSSFARRQHRNESVPMYNWHSAGSLGWPFAMPGAKYKYIFQSLKYTEAILSNGIRKPLWFEITKMLMQFKNNFISQSVSRF